MDFIKEIDEAINSGIEGFKSFIEKKTQETTDFLQQFFWIESNKRPYTVLNYLILLHQEDTKEKNLIEYIKCVEQQSTTIDSGEPVHQALACGKIPLAMYFLMGGSTEMGADAQASYTMDRLNKLDVDKRDSQGNTLLALVLNTKLPKLLACILNHKPNIHAPTLLKEINVIAQPIHQAVIIDFAEGVYRLADQGAQLDHCWGDLQETPLLLAARLCKIQAMKALLDCKAASLLLDIKNQKGLRAMDELCLHSDTNKVQSIQGIAMLLCCGAEPPSSESMRELLRRNRGLLLKAVHQYLENKPELVDGFVNRCHLTESSLHNIVYADHSWGNSIRHLFGKPSDAALIIEHLVTRKYAISQNNQPLAAEQLLQEQNPLKLYAEFVRRYSQAYNTQLISNPWSSMRWMIAEGSCNWDAVVGYAQNNPKSRTGIVYKEMFHIMSKVHEDIAKQPLEDSSNVEVSHQL